MKSMMRMPFLGLTVVMICFVLSGGCASDSQPDDSWAPDGVVKPTSQEVAQYDLLRQYRQDACTLEIAYFDGKYRKGSFRKAAEQKVLELRSKGEAAYFYHGPYRSSVTIGVWDNKTVAITQSYRSSTGQPASRTVYNVEIVELRKKYKFREYNGNYARTKRSDGKYIESYVQLVNIPTPGQVPTGWKLQTGTRR